MSAHAIDKAPDSPRAYYEGSKSGSLNPVLFQQRRILSIQLILFRPAFENRHDFKCSGVSNPTLSATNITAATHQRCLARQ